jgi:hypothetical protein
MRRQLIFGVTAALIAIPAVVAGPAEPAGVAIPIDAGAAATTALDALDKIPAMRPRGWISSETGVRLDGTSPTRRTTR